jgi:non-specific serine/threonine protein kinase
MGIAVEAGKHMLVAPSSDRPGQLPLPLTPLVGREAESAALFVLLCQPHVRLVTLTGLGGVGKTRLALAVAERLADEFRDGVAFVSLQTIVDPNLVVSVIAQCLNIRETADQSLHDTIMATLQHQEMLLVLDNFEQVLPAATVVADLLAACPGLTVLVTSRSLLRLSGERAVDVDPLELPDLQQLPSFAEFEQIDSVRLFVSHARQARSNFALTPPNAHDVAAICTRLDGLPLAIELAAARVRILSLPALLERLEQRLSVLTAGPRDVPSRQQTMRAAIAWSYDLLSPDAQRLYRHLSVFVGGWTLEAAEAFYDRPLDVLDGLSALIDHSLVAQTEAPDGTPRYAMLETIREFGLEQLAERDDINAVRRRHAEYIFASFEHAERGLVGPDAAGWVARSEIEAGNLRTALTWAVEHDADIALRVIQAIGSCWETLGYYREARRWCDLALASRQPATPSLRAYTLFLAGFLATSQGDFAAGRGYSEEGFALYQSIGDTRGAAWCLYGMGRAAMWSADLANAAELYEATVNAARDVDDRLLRSALGNLGAVHVLQRRDEEAERCLTEAIERADAAHHIVGLGYIIPEHALLALRQGDLAAATDRLDAALVIQQQLRDPRYASQAIEVAAWIATLQRLPLRAATLLGAVSSLREAISVRVPPMTQVYYDDYLPLAQAQVSPSDWDDAWQAGRALSLEEALDRARAVDTPRDDSREPAPVAGLSRRETEVLTLLVEGMSNAEIAAGLSISPHTAANHVTNIMNKLGVDSRTAAAIWAVRNGIS